MGLVYQFLIEGVDSSLKGERLKLCLMWEVQKGPTVSILTGTFNVSLSIEDLQHVYLNLQGIKVPVEKAMKIIMALLLTGVCLLMERL